MYVSQFGIYLDFETKTLIDLFNGEIYSLDDNYWNVLICLLNDKTCQSEVIKQEISELLNNRVINSNFNIDVKHIRINVSNTCNLACKYCYANQGNYGKKEEIMTIEMAKKVCAFIKDNFKHIDSISFFGGEPLLNIDSISFFGGEPLLNIDAIEYICEFFKDSHLDYSMVTNLTIVNDKILNVITKYNILLTVSLDGPKLIHDSCRVDRLGYGSYDLVIENIKKIEKTNLIKGIEATYTRITEEKYTKKELIDYFKKETNINNILIVDVETTEKNLKLRNEFKNDESEILDEVRYTINSIIENKKLVNIGYAMTVILSMFSRNSNHLYCSAGINSMTIDINGNIWPCQAYIEKHDSKISNIDTKKFEYNYEVLEKIKKFNSYKEECSNCIAKFCCTKCALGNSECPQYNCVQKQTTVKYVIEEILSLIKVNRFNEFDQALNELTK